MFKKKSLREKSPDIKRVVSPSINIPTGVPPEPSAKPQVAVFVTHGMGQQVPFEALDAAAEGLIQSANRHGNSINEIRSRTVLIGDIKTQRAEFDMRDAQKREVEVHVYEGYWAPITEGQVTLRDVMSFLFRAGLKGLWNSWFNFERWMFGREVSFGKQNGATYHLLIPLAVLLSLFGLNSVIAFVAANKLFHKECVINCASNLADPNFVALTNLAGIYLAISLVFGGTLSLLMHFKKGIKNPGTNTGWRFATRVVEILLWLWVLSTIVCGTWLLSIYLFCLKPKCLDFTCISNFWPIIWGILVFASWLIKNLIVEYMGDVAAYVDSHSLDKFDDVRSRIKETVFEYARAVYENSQYEHIALLGHSLGSAITYDTLNALINHDALHGKQLDVINRTKLMLTFGSPLDKFAFLFASQISKATATREGLAATLQPLIQAYLPFRNIKWINIYSGRDIVSGRLDFYDDLNAENYSPLRAVENVEDPDAKIPLSAHIEYWDNWKLFDELYENL